MTVRPWTPTRERPEDLDRRTVGRDRLLHTLDERLRAAATGKTRQHTLLVGPRGSGKTHLLHVAMYRAQADPSLADGLVFACIPEDADGVTSYVDLLRELAAALDLDVGFERDPATLEDALVGAAGDRTLVAVVENLDQVFDDIEVGGQANLRSWVETSGRVLLLAATPVLFRAVRDRGKPWFGGLIETPVEGLTADEGRELLTRLAQDRGDQELAKLLASPLGAARIQAVSQLTGGSPRIWMVLSDCLDTASLDDLIPAVEGLVENLAPYYQALLKDLPKTHRSIVRQLAEGRSAALTPIELAAATGLSQQTVSKALHVLKQNRWVSDAKLADDQRKTWYELREPMLRHHVHWRTKGGEPLRLIVDLLRDWYGPGELRQHLSLAAPGSPRESYLLESLRGRPGRYDLAMSSATPKSLLGHAREWLGGGDPVHPAQTGLYTELCAELALDPTFDMGTRLRLRIDEHPHLVAPSGTTLTALVTQASTGSDLATLLLTSANAATGDTAASLLLVAAALLGQVDPRRSCALLEEARTEPGSALALAIELDHAFWRGETGDASAALQTVMGLLPEIESLLGRDDSLTLMARADLARFTGAVGDGSGALQLYRSLLPDRERVLGPDDPATLRTRGDVAYFTGVTGDGVAALQSYRELLVDCERVLGAEDAETLRVRHQVAYLTAEETGDFAGALQPFAELVSDEERLLGPDNSLTLAARHQLAYYTGKTGDAVGALGLYRALLADCERVLGADDRDTLAARSQVAYYTGASGDAAGAMQLYGELLPNCERALRPDDGLTATVRRQVERWTRRVADSSGVLDLLERARAGGEEARMRLPAELRPLTEPRPA